MFSATNFGHLLTEYLRKDNYHVFKPTPLLYPTGEKDYESDMFIKREWSRLKEFLYNGTTWRVTIFGYSAPVSDTAAVELMNEAWGTPEDRNMEQFEMIDVKSEKELYNSWKGFIHTHHYDYATNFFDSSLGQTPRRTNESYFLRCYPTTPEEAFHDACPIPRNGFSTFDEMWNWYDELIEIEKEQKANPGFDS